MKLGTFIRIAAIILGIASATLLAHSALGIRINESFELFLAVLRDIVGVAVLPFELLIVAPIARWLHEHGFVFELYEHWHSAFVLLWLFNIGSMRSAAPLPGEIDEETFLTAIRWTWAAFTALLGGALAGTVPLDHPAVFWWPVTALLLFGGGDNLLFLVLERDRSTVPVVTLALTFALFFSSLALGVLEPPAIIGHPPLFWLPMAAWFLVTAVNVPTAHLALRLLVLAFSLAAGAFALGVLQGPQWLTFENSPSPGLINLAVLVTTMAALGLPLALFGPDEGSGSYMERVLNDADTRIALDIFTVLGVAAILVYLASLLA